MPIWRQPPPSQQRVVKVPIFVYWIPGLVSSFKRYYPIILAHFWQPLPKVRQRIFKIPLVGGIDYPITSSVIVGVLATASRGLGIIRTASVSIGELVSASRAINSIRSASVAIGNLVSATKLWNKLTAAAVSVGVSVAASKARGVVRSTTHPHSTEILRPAAAGDETSISQSTGATHWGEVDDVIPDDLSTYVGTNHLPGERDLYNLPAHSVGSGTINSITIYFRIACTGIYYAYGAVAAPSQKSGTTITDGTEQGQSGANVFGTKSQTYTTNPATGLPYTWVEIDALQIGQKLRSEYTGFYAICTQVYVEVDCSPGIIIGVAVSATKGLNYLKTASVITGLVVSASESWGKTKAAIVSIGTLVSASRLINLTRTATVSIGNLVSASRRLSIIRSASTIIGELVTASGARGRPVASAVSIGVVATATRAIALIRSASVQIGNLVSASRGITITRASSVVIGVKVTASRLLTITKQAVVSIGVTATASKIIAVTRTAFVTIGVAVSAIIGGGIQLIVTLYNRFLGTQLYSRLIDTPFYGRLMGTRLYSRLMDIQLKLRRKTIKK